MPDRLHGDIPDTATEGTRTYNVLMPWKTSSVMDEKLRFVYEYERDEETMVELCSRYGISRETGYVWLRRYPRAWSPGPGSAASLLTCTSLQ